MSVLVSMQIVLTQTAVSVLETMAATPSLQTVSLSKEATTINAVAEVDSAGAQWHVFCAKS